jgi:hypothetical protein
MLRSSQFQRVQTKMEFQLLVLSKVQDRNQTAQGHLHKNQPQLGGQHGGNQESARIRFETLDTDP